MKISIRDKITLMLLIVLTISISTIGIFTYKNAETIVLNEAKQSSFEKLQNINDYFLSRFMDDMSYVVAYWADNKEIKNYKNKPNQPKMVRSIPSHFQDISDQWMGYINGSPYIAWIYLGNKEDGSLYLAPLDTTMPEDYDCRTRDWYKDAVENKGNSVWSDPYLDAGETGSVVVTVAKAVESESGITGVVGMDIKLARFSDIIKDNRFGDQGYIMLVGGDGEIYSHPDEKMLLSNISYDYELSKQIVSDKGIEIFNYKGKESIISYLTVPKTNWKLIGIIPLNLEEVLAPIKYKTLLIALISVLITFMIGAFLSRMITNPLDDIMEAIHRISKGKLNEHTDIKSNDEFKILGNQFNQMMDSLRQLINERNLNVEELTKMNVEIRKNYLSTVHSLANAIEASDKYTRGHCDRVSNISMAIGKNMGVSSEDLVKLEFASILHDIGKIGISSSILNKEGKLTQEEFKIIQDHPKIGNEILCDVDFLFESRKILLQHHERIDGKGYPQKLKGEEISLLGKIISVADAYDAMTSSRPYRKTPLTKKQAIDEMLKARGTQFDGKIIDSFVRLLFNSSIEL